MKDLKDLEKALSKLSIELEENIYEAVEETTYQLRKDVVERAPIRTGTYANSIQYDVNVKDAGEGKKEVVGSVFTEYRIVSEDKWNGVPLGAFLEWGTGPLGESTNTYPHGYPYTTDEPWNWITEIQFQKTGTWGMRARPHFLPALNAIKGRYRENVKEAVKKVWTKLGL